MKNKAIPLSAFLFAFATPALADQKPADKPAAEKAAARKPPAELDALSFLAGSFSCKGTFYKNPGEAGVPTKARFSSRWGLDKYFLTFQYDQPRTKEQPAHIAAEGYFGFDAGVSRYVHGAINNVGMSVRLLGDKNGDEFVFKGEGSGPAGPHQPVVFTFKKADKGFTLTTEEDRGGKLVKVSEDTCTK